MVKQFLSLALVSILSVAGTSAAYADHNGHGNTIFTSENIGRVVGTGLGGYLGSKVGKGRGNDAAIAAGAVGGFVLGGKVGRDWNAGKRRNSHNYSNRARVRSNKGYLEPVMAMPELEEIDAPYLATRTSNVRGGPSTKYKVVEGLRPGEEVRVLGRVVEKNWYMIAQNDIIQGFVHMSLLEPAGQRYSYYGNQ